MSKLLDIVTFGEAMMMLVADRPGPIEDAEVLYKRTAGAETNVAIGLARLGFKVGWASRLGTDAMGRYLRKAMEREGIDCSRVLNDATRSTGFMFKGRVADGSDPPVEYHRKGSAASHMTVADIDVEWLCSARHLHATGVFAAVSASCNGVVQTVMAKMREAGGTVSFDPNLRPTLWSSPSVMKESINRLALQANWVLPGMEEGRFLTGEQTPEGIARFYRDQGADLVVVKLGAEGAYFDGKIGGEWMAGYAPPFPVAEVIDTVGAGDGFAVGIISALLEELPIAQAVKRAAWIGARAVQVVGDTEGLPTRDELRAAGM